MKTITTTIAIWLNLVSCIFGILIFIITWYQIMMNVDTTQFRFNVAIISIIAMLMYTISSGAICYMFYKVDIDAVYNDSTLMATNSISVIEMSWRIGQSMTYLLFMKRLQNSFTKTKYQPSKSIYCLFYFGIILFLAVYIITKTIWMLCTFSKACFLPSSVLHHFFLWFTMDVITLIVDLILSISMIILFVSKLWNLTQDAILTQESQKLLNNNNNEIITISSE
eukprot:239840_1